MVRTYKDWHEMLLFSLHGYHTSVCTSTRETLYSLVYGIEAILPIKVEIHSLRVLLKTKLKEAEWIQTQIDQLNLIEEKRLITLCHGQLYQRRMKKAYDKFVLKNFKKGIWCLKRCCPSRISIKENGVQIMKGPMSFLEGTLILTNMDGEDLLHLANFDTVKKYYT
ncbi:hypothetical protein CR513_49963, partial [Mucuna pruriens]